MGARRSLATLGAARAAVDRVKHTRPAICKISKRIHDMHAQH
jgi:hypothetical protein